MKLYRARAKEREGEKEYVSINENTFRVVRHGQSGPASGLHSQGCHKTGNQGNVREIENDQKNQSGNFADFSEMEDKEFVTILIVHFERAMPVSIDM